MSDAFVTIIPADPLFVPAPANQRDAVAIFSGIVAGADEISFDTSDDVRLIDAGSNWEGTVSATPRSQVVVVAGNRRRTAILAAAMVSAGCAHYAVGMRPTEKRSSDTAYLYGRFSMKAKADPLATNGRQTMGFVINCEDGATYTIRFTNTREVQVIKIRPSHCSLQELIYTDGDGYIHSRKAPPPSWVRGEQFSAGRAYYLGDYFGKAEYSVERTAFFQERKWSWLMDPVDDNYPSTTEEMKRTFVHLASLSTEDKRLAPRRRLPGSGAAGPVTGLAEVPLSPERIARIAPLTKRRYGTPAACLRACPTGQCLPFRAESGPSMTCIIRCKTDKDCPHGLACNCAETDAGGSDCHPIAHTSEDAMEGICLSPESPAEPR
jgi:hypothetical protein